MTHADDDGYGLEGSALLACLQPDGYAHELGDCDDGSSAHSPGAIEGCDGQDYDCDGFVDNDLDGDGFASEDCGGTDCDDSDPDYPNETGACPEGADCLDVLEADPDAETGSYLIDPDGPDGFDPISVHCDMDYEGGGWTLCASLTKGYVPAEMLYMENAYAFQARLNDDDNYVYDTDSPARFTTTWDDPESMNHGQFCRLMGEDVEQTRVDAKMWYYTNDGASTLYATEYDMTKSGRFEGNVYTQWFSNTDELRSFVHIDGDALYQQSSVDYSSLYYAPIIGWTNHFATDWPHAGSYSGSPYSQSINPWSDFYSAVDGNVQCVGCTNSSAGSITSYTHLPYGNQSILNDMSHSFWDGIENIPYGWSDCTANGNCDYHESGLGVWLFYVR